MGNGLPVAATISGLVVLMAGAAYMVAETQLGGDRSSRKSIEDTICLTAGPPTATA
jgi:hypothetical protein